MVEEKQTLDAEIRKKLSVDAEQYKNYLIDNPEQQLKLDITLNWINEHIEDIYKYITKAKHFQEQYKWELPFKYKCPVWNNAVRGIKLKREGQYIVSNGTRLGLLYSGGEVGAEAKYQAWKKIREAKEKGDYAYLNKPEVLQEQMRMWLDFSKPRDCTNKCPLFNQCKFRAISHIPKEHQEHQKYQTRYGPKWRTGKCALWYEKRLGNKIADMHLKILTGDKEEWDNVLKYLTDELAHEAMFSRDATLKNKLAYYRAFLLGHEKLFGSKSEVTHKAKMELPEDVILKWLNGEGELPNTKKEENGQEKA